MPMMPDSAKGRVDHPVLAAALQQAVGDAEHAPVLAHVLAQHDHLGVAGHLVEQGLVDGLHQVHPRHG